MRWRRRCLGLRRWRGGSCGCEECREHCRYCAHPAIADGPGLWVVLLHNSNAEGAPQLEVMDHFGFADTKFFGPVGMASHGRPWSERRLGDRSGGEGTDGMGRSVGTSCTSNFAGGACPGYVRPTEVDFTDCGRVCRRNAVLGVQDDSLGMRVASVPPLSG